MSLVSEAESDLLWDELNLDDLIKGMDKQPQSVKDILIADIACSVKPLPDKKLQKVFKKPVYGALMNRYRSAPHIPKSISPSKINLLADPLSKLGGRYNAYERGKRAQKVAAVAAAEVSDEDSSLRGESSDSLLMQYQRRQQQHQPETRKEPASSFFLTGEDDDGEESDHYASNDNYGRLGNRNSNKPTTNNNKVGFASALRSKVKPTSVIRADMLQRAPVLSNAKRPDLRSKIGGGASRKPNQKAPGRKEGVGGGGRKVSKPLKHQPWQENTVANTFQPKFKRKQGPGAMKASDSNTGRLKNTKFLKNPHTKKMVKIISSGYGGGLGPAGREGGTGTGTKVGSKPNEYTSKIEKRNAVLTKKILKGSRNQEGQYTALTFHLP